MASLHMDQRDAKTPVGHTNNSDHPPSYERASSPSNTAPSTLYDGEVDTGPRALQPDHSYTHPQHTGNNYSSPNPTYAGPSNMHHQVSNPTMQHHNSHPSMHSMSPPPAGYYQPPPPAVSPMAQHQQTIHQQPPHNPYETQHAPQQMDSINYEPSRPAAGPTGAKVGTPSGQFKNITPMYALTSAPAPVECPACGARALTRTHTVVGNTTHAWAAGVCLFTCLGCIPYCVGGTKDVEHKCGNCGVRLASWHRSGRTEVLMHA